MRKSNRKYLLLIFLAAFLLRLYRINDMSLRADEASNLYLAAQEPGAIVHALVTDNPYLPLYFFILHFWMLVAGKSELAVRFPTVFAGVLSIALIYALGKILFPNRPSIALIAAMLAAINPYLIWDAQDVHLYAFLVLAMSSSFVTFLWALRRSDSLRAWAQYIIASTLALFLHYLAGLILIAEGIGWLVLTIRGKISRRASTFWIVAQVVIAALFVPWLAFALPLVANFKTDFFPPADWPEILNRSLVALTVGRADNRLMPPMVDPFSGNILAWGFFGIFLFGLFAQLKIPSIVMDGEGRAVLAIYLFVPPIIIFLFSTIRFPIFDERYILFLAPAFLLIVARGLVALSERFSNRWIPATALIFVLFASGHSLYNYYFVPEFAKSPDWPSFVANIFSESKPGDVLIQNYPDPALPYYLMNHIPRVLLPRASAQNASDIAADLERLTTRYDRVWFQPAPNSTWDTEGLVAMWLARHARKMRGYEVRGARLELYLTGTTALREAKPIGAIFDERMELIAYDLEQAKPLHLTLYWQAREKLNRDYTVFVHLYSNDGKLIAQKDTTPVNGTFPMTQWKANETIVDAYEIAIPRDAPSGTYALMVGMYDAQTQTRLQVVDHQGVPFPENRVPIAEVTRE